MAKKPEQKVWTRVSSDLTKAGVPWFDRVESSASKNGFPDVICKWFPPDGRNGLTFIELKAGVTLARGVIKVPDWTVQQRRWCERSWKANTPYWLAVGEMHPVTGNVVSVWYLNPFFYLDMPEGKTYFDPSYYDGTAGVFRVIGPDCRPHNVYRSSP